MATMTRQAQAQTRAEGARRDRVKALEALIEVNTQIHAEEFNADRILALIVDRARELIGADVAWMGLADQERKRSTAAVQCGANTPALLSVEVELGTGLSGLAAKKGHTIILSGEDLYSNVPTAAQNALRTEGMVTVMCAPMRHVKEVGALLVGSRHQADFDEAQAALLQALASQAAIAIANSRLYKALEEKHRTLEQTLALHRALGDAALAGDGLDAIVERLAHLIERDIALQPPDGSAPSWRYFAHRPGHQSLDEKATASLADSPGLDITVGSETFGRLHVLGTGEISEIAHNALLQGATIVALEMTKERAAREVEWRLRGELLEEMLQSDETWSEGLLLRCERLGVDPAAERCIAVLEPLEAGRNATLSSAVRTAASHLIEGKTTLTSRRGDRVLVAMETDGAGGVSAIETLLVRAERAGAPSRAGLSSSRHGVAIALREAEAALRLAREGQGAGTMVSYEQLGRLRFLLSAPDTAEMSAMVRDLLGPVAEYDRRRKSSLLETLQAYLEVGGHHPSTAERCHIHASTLKYRLARISEVLGRSLTEPGTRFELSLAFAVRELLATLGVREP
jgi:DNA-binding PucR family transcriptional regulator